MKVKRRTVFTTHTPVAAGNEVHWVDTLLEGGFFAVLPVKQLLIWAEKTSL